MSETANSFGLYLIQLDYRITAFVSLLALGLIYFVSSFLASRSGDNLEAWKVPLKSVTGALLALFCSYSAVKIGAVFLLTKPPAIEHLDDSEIGTVGLISFVVLIALSFYGVIEFCHRAKKP